MKKIKILLTIAIFVVLLANDSNGVSAMEISSQCGILMEQSTGRVLYEKCPDDQMYIASITKILTTIVAIENANLDEWVEISDNVTRQVGSALYLMLGDQVKLIDLLYGLMLRSGNDAAMAIAEFVGGDEASFVKMMNDKAKEIGITNSVFQNPSGLDETTYNLSTARDMALIMQYAMNNPIFREITRTETHKATTKNGMTYVWHNKNKLLSSYKYCVGGKTGFTERARRTLVTNASKDGVNLTIVTFNDGNDFKDHKDLYEKYFGSLREYEIVSEGYIDSKYDDSYVDKSFKMSLSKDEFKRVRKEISYYENSASKAVGRISVSLDGKEYFSRDIYIKDRVKKEEVKLSFWQRLIKRLKELW